MQTKLLLNQNGRRLMIFLSVIVWIADCYCFSCTISNAKHVEVLLWLGNVRETIHRIHDVQRILLLALTTLRPTLGVWTIKPRLFIIVLPWMICIDALHLFRCTCSVLSAGCALYILLYFLFVDACYNHCRRAGGSISDCNNVCNANANNSLSSSRG